MSDWWEKRGAGPPYPKILPSKTPSSRWQWGGSWLIYWKLWSHKWMNIDSSPKLTYSVGRGNSKVYLLMLSCVSISHFSHGKQKLRKWFWETLTNQFWNNAGRWQISSAAKWYPADVCARWNWEKWRFLESVFPGSRNAQSASHSPRWFSGAFRAGPSSPANWDESTLGSLQCEGETNVGNKQLGESLLLLMPP